MNEQMKGGRKYGTGLAWTSNDDVPCRVEVFKVLFNHIYSTIWGCHTS